MMIGDAIYHLFSYTSQPEQKKLTNYFNEKTVTTLMLLLNVARAGNIEVSMFWRGQHCVSLFVNVTRSDVDQSRASILR